jgi:hypothetical protein
MVYIMFFLSLCYLAFLVSTSRPGVFYSSDGGIKYMVVKQLAEGHGFKYLYLPQPQWVHTIWDNGFFPLKPPFLYPTPEGYLFVFPPALQIISSFFYSTFGYPGLYIIPVLSTVLFWLCVVMLLRRCGLDPLPIAAGLFVLVFCSPLTIYGATYWEHMPAILLLLPRGCGGDGIDQRTGGLVQARGDDDEYFVCPGGGFPLFLFTAATGYSGLPGGYGDRHRQFFGIQQD